MGKTFVRDASGLTGTWVDDTPVNPEEAEYQEEQRSIDRRWREQQALGRQEEINGARSMVRFATEAARAAIQERAERRHRLRALLGQAIRAEREARGLTQEQVAELAGLGHRARVATAELNTAQNDIETLDRILDAVRQAEPAEARP